MNIGGVTVGSEHPIRVQTMTTTDTKDVQGTVEQVFIVCPLRLSMNLTSSQCDICFVVGRPLR